MHPPLTCTVFDPMVHPQIEVAKHILGLHFEGKGSFAESRQIRFHFCRGAKHLMEVLQLAGLEKEGLFNELVKEAGTISSICASALKSTREKFAAYKDKNKKENLKASV